ncbi:MAG: hypothetical protein WD733_05245 [Bryobacterales bacterium]
MSYLRSSACICGYIRFSSLLLVRCRVDPTLAGGARIAFGDCQHRLFHFLFMLTLAMGIGASTVNATLRVTRASDGTAPPPTPARSWLPAPPSESPPTPLMARYPLELPFRLSSIMRSFREYFASHS